MSIANIIRSLLDNKNTQPSLFCANCWQWQTIEAFKEIQDEPKTFISCPSCNVPLIVGIVNNDDHPPGTDCHKSCCHDSEICATEREDCVCRETDQS